MNEWTRCGEGAVRVSVRGEGAAGCGRGKVLMKVVT
jgi:hypothetical protein